MLLCNGAKLFRDAQPALEFGLFFCGHSRNAPDRSEHLAVIAEAHHLTEMQVMGQRR